MTSINCCIGIMAYNEAANIGNLLNALTNQVTDIVNIDSITVVASGCTDNTEQIVQEYVERDSRVHLLTQPKRYGKASAVNLFLKNASCDIVVLESADTIPTRNSIEALVSLFADPSVGMVGGHPIPMNRPDTFMGFGVNLLWELHHRISLHHPKMGELIAFRHIFRQIPHDTAVDEASIEPLIIGQGLKCAYAPAAVIYNWGPESVRDFVKQRRRIYAGHLYVKETLGYRVSTMNGFRIVSVFLKILKLDWRYFVWSPLIIALEIFVRFLGVYDYYLLKRNPFQWKMVESTKRTVSYPAGSMELAVTGKVEKINDHGS